MGVPSKAAVAKVIRDLKAWQKDVAKKRDQLVELKSTVEELIGDCEEADSDIDAAVEKLSRLQ